MQATIGKSRLANQDRVTAQVQLCSHIGVDGSPLPNKGRHHTKAPNTHKGDSTYCHSSRGIGFFDPPTRNHCLLVVLLSSSFFRTCVVVCYVVRSSDQFDSNGEDQAGMT